MERTQTLSNASNYQLKLILNETGTSITDNTSTVSWTLQLIKTSGSGYYSYVVENPINLVLDGETVYSNNISYDFRTSTPCTITVASGTKTIKHNDDGSKSLSYSTYFNDVSNNRGSATISGNMTLTKIARYFTSISISLSKAEETTLKYSWTTSETCSKYTIYYKKASDSSYTTGSTVTANSKSGTFTISSLSANTSYNVYIAGTRSDSGLSSNSSTVTNSTIAYPYCTKAPDFTIGNNVTVEFYNPLNRTIQIQMWSIVGSCFVSELISCSGTSYTGFSDVKNRLYSSIPSATESSYNIDVHYSGNKSVFGGGKYKIKGTEVPTFSNFTYEDTNETTLGLTSNNQLLVDNYSSCKFTISTTNKATPYTGASISKYVIAWGSKTANVTYSSTEDVSGSLTSSGNTISITAYDSRGLTKTVSKSITNIVSNNLTINNLITQRKDGVNTETYLAGKVTVWAGNWDKSSRANDLQEVKYRTRTNSSEYGDWRDITDSFKSKASTSTINEIKTYTLDIDDGLAIHATGTSGGFEVGTEYQLDLYVRDGYGDYYIYSLDEYTTVTDGKVGMSRFKDSNGNYHYGFDGMPNEDYIITLGDTGVFKYIEI